MTTHQRNFPSIDPAKLERLAQTAVKVGLRLQPGQDLFLTAPVAALPLARADRGRGLQGGRGAGDADPLRRGDDAGALSLRPGGKLRPRARLALRRRRKAFGANTARLAIVGEDPMLLAHEDPAKVARASKANSIAYQPALEKIAGFDINWNIVAYPTESWAKRVFPGETEDVAVGRLAEAIFSASRVDNDDPVAAWTTHNAALSRRTQWLNARKFHALHYSGPGTDLTIGLADDHEWEGGAATAKNGITCNPNIPTEEVFTTPHARRVDGHVVSTKPLSYQGSLIDGIAVRFEAGRIVEAKAARGEDVLNKVLDSDDGARRLGEVALVPHSSPISKSGLLFFNTLFDENAACHIALGQCYAKCFVGGDKLTPDEIAARGGNKSMIHIDWMIGSDRIDIDGVDADWRPHAGLPQGRMGLLSPKEEGFTRRAQPRRA